MWWYFADKVVSVARIRRENFKRIFFVHSVAPWGSFVFFPDHFFLNHPTSLKLRGTSRGTETQRVCFGLGLRIGEVSDVDIWTLVPTSLCATVSPWLVKFKIQTRLICPA